MSRPPRRAAGGLLLALVLLASACGSDGAAGSPRRSTEPVGRSVDTLDGARARLVDVFHATGIPTGIAFRTGDDARYVALRDGRIVRSDPGGATTTLLDVSDAVTLDGEGGLFDLVFTLDGRRLLASYARAADHHLLVVSFSVDSRGRAGAPTVVVDIGDGGAIHNGGSLLVLPGGELLVGVGDGGELNDVAGLSRRPGSLRGRILRYPTLGRDGLTVGDVEVAAMGLRNPWRMSRDASTGTVWIGDVGQARWEEIDRLDDPDEASEVDFGWDLTEGFDRSRGVPPPGWQPPEAVAPHDASHCAIVGGPVLRDAALPDLAGALVVGDYCSPDVRLVVLRPGRSALRRKLTLPAAATVVAFGEGLHHEVYVLASDGSILRIDPGGTGLAEDPAPLGARPLPTTEGPRAICGLPAAIAAYPAMQTKTPAEVRVLAADLRTALALYRSADLPAAARAPFAQLDDGLTRYLDLLAAAGDDPTDPALVAQVAAGPDQASAYAELVAIEESACTR